jgi:DNA polymerase V
MGKKIEGQVSIGVDEFRDIMAKSGSELAAELSAQGVDVEAAVSDLRKLGRAMRRKWGATFEAQAAVPRGAAVALPRFEELVAAGKPAWVQDAHAPAEMTTILEILGCSSPEEALWARVSGWSMRDAGIRDGDMVLVKSAQEANDGEMVLAHLQGHGQVVKRLRRKDGRVVLESANPDFADIVVEDASHLRIHGVVLGRAGFV